MLKKYVAVLLTAVSVMSAGCEQQPPVVEPPSVDKPPSVETTTPTAPPDERVEPKSEPPQKTETTPPVEKARVEDMKVKVYYPDESGLRLVEVEREIKVSKDADKYAAAVETMMTAPAEQELTEIFPKRAKLLDVTVDNGVATVNFDGELQKHFVGGSAGETFLVGSVVNTLTNFDEIKSVLILIDGQKIESLAGHMDLSEPIERMDNLMNNN